MGLRQSRQGCFVRGMALDLDRAGRPLGRAGLLIAEKSLDALLIARRAVICGSLVEAGHGVLKTGDRALLGAGGAAGEAA